MVGAMKLSQWARFWSEPKTRVGFIPVVFNLLPMETRAHFSAGFELRAGQGTENGIGELGGPGRDQRPPASARRFGELPFSGTPRVASRRSDRPRDVIAFYN